MNICSEHHEIKRKIGRIIVRILIKNCKRYFSLTKISVLYMFLKHDPKLWSLRKVLPNVSTVFGIWMKARIKHTEVFLVFFVWGVFFVFFLFLIIFFFCPMQSWHSSPIADFISRDTPLVSSLSCQKVTWN